MCRRPRHLDVDQWIVGHIKRIGNISQEFAQALIPLAGDSAAAAHHYNQGEQHKYGQYLIKAVKPIIFGIGTSDARHNQYHCQYHGAYNKSMTRNAYLKLGHPADDKTRQERICQSRKTDQELVGGQAPPADHCIGSIVSYIKHSENIYIKADIHHKQCRQYRKDYKAAQPETAQDGAIQKIGDILPQERPCSAIERIKLRPAADIP